MAMTPTAADVSEDVSAPARRSIPWKHSPLIVGTISTNAGLSHLIEAPQGIDLVEVRLDLLLSNGVAPKLIQQALAQRSVPALLTLRTRDEGGAFNWRSRQRVLFFMAFIFPLAEKETYTSATPPTPQPVPENACLFVQNRRSRSSSSRSARTGRTPAHPLPYASRHHGYWPARHRFAPLSPRLRITPSLCSPRRSHRLGPTQPRRHLLVSPTPPYFFS